jgi:CRISPR type III-B/RAMP module RAMP protein Cmr1
MKEANEFTVKIKTLTPIWTGDENGECKTLRETGIIGSLRWWYEALIRGLGRYACDPTNSKCDGKNHCDACELFGCTGWARRFILQIATLDRSYAPFVIAMPNSSKKPYFLGYYGSGGVGYEKNGGLLGEHKLTFIVEKSDTLNLIKLLLKLSTEWGLGVGVQKGLGISHVEGDLNFSDVKIPKNQNYPQEMDYRLPLPRIDQFFFYKIPFKNEAISKIREVIEANIYKTWRDLQNNKPLNETFSSYHYIPTSPWIRGAIRASFRDNEELRHFIMGFVSVKGNPKPIHLDCWKHSIIKDKTNDDKYYCSVCHKRRIEEKEILEKTGSKIFASHLYDENSFIDSKEPAWRMKIWGWIPEIPDKIGVTREKVIEIIQNKIKEEDFWKNAFGLDENPVDIDNISEKWNVNPLEILKDGGGII